MNESTIKSLFKSLIERIIIPKYPFLELHSMQGPSESINQLATVFYTVFTTSIPLDYTMVKEIKHEVSNLFKSAGFSMYSNKKYFNYYNYGVRVEIADKKNGDIIEEL